MTCPDCGFALTETTLTAADTGADSPLIGCQALVCPTCERAARELAAHDRGDWMQCGCLDCEREQVRFAATFAEREQRADFDRTLRLIGEALQTPAPAFEVPFTLTAQSVRRPAPRARALWDDDQPF